MSARSYYFRTLSRMTDGLSGHLDAQMSETFARLGRLFRLLDLRTAAGDEPTVDRLKSGLPILKEIVQVAKDLELGMAGEVGDVRTLRAAMLDDMLLRRRVPDERAIRGVAQAIYAEAVAKDRIDVSGPVPCSPVFQPTAEYSFSVSDLGSDGRLASWDFWDGTTSRAIRTFARFTLRNAPAWTEDGVLPAEIAEIKAAASKFSGASFSPLTLATEIDDKTSHLRLTSLSRVTVGPFISDIFYDVEDPIMDAIKSAEDIEDAWAIRWTVDHIRAGSTSTVGGGLFSKPRYQQNFLVDTTDPDCAMRSVTSFERHVAMPHGMYQRLAHRRNECPSLRSALIHVLTGEGRLIENN